MSHPPILPGAGNLSLLGAPAPHLLCTFLLPSIGELDLESREGHTHLCGACDTLALFCFRCLINICLCTSGPGMSQAALHTLLA